MDVRSVAGQIGAEIIGVRLSGNLEPAIVDAIKQTLLTYKVLFFRGQDHLDEAIQEAFGEFYRMGIHAREKQVVNPPMTEPSHQRDCRKG